MERKRSHPDDDDGRTIADMSGVEHPSLLGSLVGARMSDAIKRPGRSAQESPSRKDRPWEDTGLSREERRWYLLGALKAALLIAVVFIAGLGLFIALLLLLWNH